MRLLLVLLINAALASAADPWLETQLAQPILVPRQTLIEAEIHLASRVKPIPPIGDRAQWDRYAAQLRTQILDNVVFRGEVKKMGPAAGMAGGGGVLLHLALLMFALAMGSLLAQAMPTWVAFLTVAIAIGIIGAGMLFAALRVISVDSDEHAGLDPDIEKGRNLFPVRFVFGIEL